MTSRRRAALVAVALVGIAVGVGYGGAPMSAQGGAPTTSFSGVVDPTNVAWSGGMSACTSSCSSFTTRNALALTGVAAAASSSNGRTIYIPPGTYPLPCGVDLGSYSNLKFDAINVTFRLTGTCASNGMLLVHNGAHVRFFGATFDMRDATGTNTDTVAVKVGDGGTTTIDDVEFVDCAFENGVGGDYIRIDGGSAAVTVTNVKVTQGSKFENGARAGVDVRSGVSKLEVTYSYFRNDANRDVWFEPQAAGSIGGSVIMGNMFERAASGATEQAVTLSGFSGASPSDQNVFAFNRIKHIVGASVATGTTWFAGGGTLEANGLTNTVIEYNTVVTNVASTGASINLTGLVKDVSVVGNVCDRRSTASNAACIAVNDDGTNAPSYVTVERNAVDQYSGIAAGIDVAGCQRCTVDSNNIRYHASTAVSGTTGFAGVNCQGDTVAAVDVPCSGRWTANNVARDYQDAWATLDLSTVTTHDNTVVRFGVPGLPGNTATVQFIGDAATSAGTIGGTEWNLIIHYKAAATTVAQVETLIGQTAFVVKTSGTAGNVLQSGDAFGPTALVAVPQAGQPHAGLRFLAGAGTSANSMLVRDNHVDGPADMVYSDVSSWPEGQPLLAGNTFVNGTTEEAGGFTWVTDTTLDTETVSSGALSSNLHTTFATAAGGTSLTLPAGIVDGFDKYVVVKSYSSSGNVTLTPSAMANGTSHTLTWTAANGFAHLKWDATASTWRLVGLNGVTLN